MLGGGGGGVVNGLPARLCLKVLCRPSRWTWLAESGVIRCSYLPVLSKTGTSLNGTVT
jgi:hypothetical protein